MVLLVWKAWSKMHIKLISMINGSFTRTEMWQHNGKHRLSKGEYSINLLWGCHNSTISVQYNTLFLRHTKKFAKHFPEIPWCCGIKAVSTANTVFTGKRPQRYMVWLFPSRPNFSSQSQSDRKKIPFWKQLLTKSLRVRCLSKGPFLILIPKHINNA